jgi:hypothetical protein
MNQIAEIFLYDMTIHGYKQAVAEEAEAQAYLFLKLNQQRHPLEKDGLNHLPPNYLFGTAHIG